MRAMSLRALHRQPPASEAVQVTHGGEIIGTFIPVGVAAPEEAPVRVAPVGPMTQAERDKVLRRVAKG